MKTNIRHLLKQANVVLFTDSEHFNKNVTGVKNLSDIKDQFQIKGDLKKVSFYSSKVVYKLINSDYEFTLTLINN